MLKQISTLNLWHLQGAIKSLKSFLFVIRKHDDPPESMCQRHLRFVMQALVESQYSASCSSPMYIGHDGMLSFKVVSLTDHF